MRSLVLVLALLGACATSPQDDLSRFLQLATIDCSGDLICGFAAQPTCMSDALRDGHVAKFEESLVPQDDPNYDDKYLFTYQGAVHAFEDAFDQPTGGEDVTEQHCAGIEADTETVFWSGCSGPNWTWDATGCK